MVPRLYLLYFWLFEVALCKIISTWVIWYGKPTIDYRCPFECYVELSAVVRFYDSWIAEIAKYFDQ
ncbi:unnamed protein product, partial [Absidia cylindrospora]